MIKTTIRGQALDIRDGIVWARYDLSGQRIAQGTTHGTIPTADQLVEWDEMAATAIDAVLATEIVASKPTIRRVGRYGTCNPADCGPDCQGDCSYDSERRRQPTAREMWREYTAEDMGW